ncbi:MULTISPECIES: PLP-dependent cysteine synthase family protein [Sphingobacterium]|uniref:Cysteine synthase family protein n=1 Tax=Sphingobacterium tenebrionis TaxID=3111775 RepID=A0ABU8I640_9SPHI|nr:cysteine synthase family protein [Sphingobacterium sp. CZ-2]
MLREKIGNTALHKHTELSARYGVNIFIKEEYHNPGKSAKDRVALFMMEEAIKQNRLPKGGTFVEASSGNTGISVAMIAKEMGYKSKIFVSQSCSQEKIEVLESYGAEVVVCENSNGLHDFQSTQYLAQAYAANTEDAYFTNQYYNSSNIRAHYKTTGPEIWNQTAGKVSHVLIGMGTGGTISGVGRYLKEMNPSIKVFGVEPNNSVYQHFLIQQKLPEMEVKFDSIEGIGRTFIPGSFDVNTVDRVFQVSLEASKEMAHEFALEFNQLLGYSSAAVLAALDKHIGAMDLKPTDNLVLLFPDYGDRYLEKLYKDFYWISKAKVARKDATIQ